MKIYLMRHGQTTGDLEDRYGGDYDDHLTDEGRKQAEELAQKLSGRNIEIIFHSPLLRAQETAHILVESLKIPKMEIESLRERNAYGILTGMVKAEAREKYPNQVELLKDPHNTVQGGEEYEVFRKRILGQFEKLANGNYQTIGVVTHGGPIYCFFREIVGEGELKHLGDCAIIELEYQTGQFELISMDSASY
jgi:broad specificity phosphatase PhoE